MLSESTGGSFWAAWQNGYNLSEWRNDATLVRRFERRPAWFNGSAPSRIGGPNKAPDPFIRGIERDADGLLWVFINTPGKNWQDGWPKIAPGQREVRGSDMVYGKLFDTMIEVIDPRTARVVARAQFDGYAMSILTGKRAAFLEQTPDGDERIVIREFRLSGS